MADSKYGPLITENREHRHSDWVDQIPRDPESGEILNWVDAQVIPGAFYYESFMAKKPTIEGKERLVNFVSYRKHRLFLNNDHSRF